MYKRRAIPSFQSGSRGRLSSMSSKIASWSLSKNRLNNPGIKLAALNLTRISPSWRIVKRLVRGEGLDWPLMYVALELRTAPKRSERAMNTLDEAFPVDKRTSVNHVYISNADSLRLSSRASVHESTKLVIIWMQRLWALSQRSNSYVCKHFSPRSSRISSNKSRAAPENEL